MERSGIAPYDLIARDFRALDLEETLRTTWDVERVILMQSVQGHAHEGHGLFSGIKYPNTTIDDISRALRLDPTWVRLERERLINGIEQYVSCVLNGEQSPPLEDDEGQALLGSAMFRNLDVPGSEVLRGLYLGGLRDDPRIRSETETVYNLRIGGGKCYLVNTEVMNQLGLDGDVLAHGSHADMLEYYTDCGLIRSEEGPDGDKVAYMYIRHRRGAGASDDAAIVAAGILYGLAAAIGVFLADAIDTLEKHVPVFADRDQKLADRIKASYARLSVSDSEIRHLVFLSAMPERSQIDVPDSSLRHLLLIDRKHDVTAVESHLLFVQGKHCPSIRIGHEETSSDQFYDYLSGRVRESPGPL